MVYPPYHIKEYHHHFHFDQNGVEYQNHFLIEKVVGNYLKAFIELCFGDQKEFTAQKIKFSMKDFFSKCDQISSF